MCRDLAHGGARCSRACPTPGTSASSPERALARSEAVAEEARAAFAAEADAALDALFTRVAEAATPAERTDAVRAFLDALSFLWHGVIRSIERAHERRIASLDARWRDRLGAELSAAQAARRAQELVAVNRVAAAERVLAEEELLARGPDWGDELWRACHEADLEWLQHGLDAERLRLRKLEARQSRRPDPRVSSEIRRGQARTECWRLTLDGQRSRLAATPRTRAEAQQRCAEAQHDVEAAQAALRAMTGAPGSGLTADERAYRANPDLVTAVEHSRQHPVERRELPPRPVAEAHR